MNEESKQHSEKKPAKVSSPGNEEELQFTKERNNFKFLVLANPNYFGNLKVSPYKPVLNIQSNTTYEEIGCVGFQPQFNHLEAVVFVKQPTGYGGNICSNGTPEYVRFYMSCGPNADWVDVGLTSFRAYNIPEGTQGAKRLEYAVSLEIKPSKKFCIFENICKVRAILSWNIPPPPNTPDYTPVWGEVHDTYIQIDPLKLILVEDLLQVAKAKIPDNIKDIVDLATPITLPEPKQLNLIQLKEKYQNKGVESFRFGLPHLQKMSDQLQAFDFLAMPEAQSVFSELDIDIDEWLSVLTQTDGNTRYEELECIGLDPNQEMLVGVVRVKLPNGYSGGQCSAGSREFVTFWADFNNNGTFETCLGTTSVNVYDINNLPNEGLEYAVFLPVDLSKYYKPCQEGPVVVRIRAILSWAIPPPCANPKYIPVWGNREETLIHIKPGQKPVPGIHFPIIQTVGSMDVGDINVFSGLATGPAALAGFTANQSPFGGRVFITGRIANPPDFTAGANKIKYKIEIRSGGGWSPLTNAFTIHRDQLLNGIWSDLPPIVQSVDADNYYEYQEDLTGGPGNAQIFVVGNMMGIWYTGGLSGLWQIRVVAKHPVTGITWNSNTVTVKLDNIAPDVHIDITSGGGACADFLSGDVISGTYSVADEHFGRLTFRVLPPVIGGSPSGGSFTNPAPLPAGGTMPLIRTFVGGVPTVGESGNWSLNTSGMQKCGYVIELSVLDRTIVDSGSIGRYNRDLVGLCLREPSPEG